MKENIQLVTSSTLQGIIDTPVYTIRQWTREGLIPAYKVSSKSYLYDPAEVIKKIKEQQAN